MSKHTVFVEAPPFAKFSDAEMRRLLDDERLEVLDWRGKRVNTPGFVEALATADIAVTGNSLTITDELLEKLPNLKLIALWHRLDMIDIPAVPGAASCWQYARREQRGRGGTYLRVAARLPAQRAAV
ncbi:MAG: hypothetical protein ACLTTU_02600 [Bilophila wadsworthia]